ncbi:hypothetical protein BDK51DRAFT_48806 [Blyttiomyces helicus]|uniref:Uncharacterized protein n=1 Tax=Blyttiomyces helicus TaxID=388810 RepID=A0A4P9WEV8_9FUNG|nr:hypothetical protein BDK51DRAFT_48806 [Blyttiomyces helicus]|eukprot:RKO89818.1 hypothetical protein BDK51DRAFT_48806 [Blyttiomyces helicus]
MLIFLGGTLATQGIFKPHRRMRRRGRRSEPEEKTGDPIKWPEKKEVAKLPGGRANFQASGLWTTTPSAAAESSWQHRRQAFSAFSALETTRDDGVLPPEGLRDGGHFFGEGELALECGVSQAGSFLCRPGLGGALATQAIFQATSSTDAEGGPSPEKTRKPKQMAGKEGIPCLRRAVKSIRKWQSYQEAAPTSVLILVDPRIAPPVAVAVTALTRPPSAWPLDEDAFRSSRKQLATPRPFQRDCSFVCIRISRWPRRNPVPIASA